MATLATQNISRAGIVPSYAAAAGGGDKVRVGDTTFLHVKNGSGGSLTVTVVTPGTYDGQAVADLAVAVAAGAEKMIGPIGKVFRGTGGLADITYSGVTSLTIAALSI